MTSCGCREPRALLAPTCARARYQYGLVEFTLRVWEYSDETMAVDPTSSYDSSPSSLLSVTSGVADHVGLLLLGIYWNLVSCPQVSRFVGITSMVEISLFTLYSVNCRYKVPVRPLRGCCRLNSWLLQASTGKMLNIPVWHRHVTPHASALAAIDFRSTVGKNPFFL